MKAISRDKLVIAVTHDNENAEKYADRIIALADGSVVSDKLNNTKLVKLTTEKNQINSQAESVIIENSVPKSVIKGDIACDMSRKTKSINKKNSSKGINVASLTKLSFINIWKKKFRLLVTVLLFFFMLTLFGVGLSALRYDKVTVALETFYKSEVNEFKAGALYTDEIVHELVFREEKIAELEQKFPEYKFNKMMTTGPSLPWIVAPGINENYRVDNLAVIDDDVMAQYGFTKVWGSLPTTFNEVCLSKFVADEMIDKKIYMEIRSYADFVRFTLPTNEFPDVSLKVVGIIDTKVDKIFEKMSAINDMKKERPIWNELNGSFSLSLMVDDSFMESIFYNNNSAKIEYSYNAYHYLLPHSVHAPMLEEVKAGVRQESYGKLMREKYGEIVYANGKTSLSENEIIVSESVIKNKAREMFPDVYNTDGIQYTQIIEYLNSGLGVINNASFGFLGEKNNYKIAGFYRSSNDGVKDILVNDEVIRKANTYAAAAYINTTLKGDRKQDLRLMAEFMQTPYYPESYCMPDIEGANNNAETFKKFGMYASLAFGVFSILMMSNFIVTSINTNKKQIGVLRALGMRTSGIAYIFLFEALIVGLLAFLISVITDYLLLYCCLPL